MPTELGEESPQIGRHARLAHEYAQASLSLDRASLSLDRDPAPAPPPLAAAGRLAADYRRVVAELVNNPAAFYRVVLDERFDGITRGWPNDPDRAARLVPIGYRLSAGLDDQFVAVGAPVGSSLRDVLVGATFRKRDGRSGGVYGLLLRDRGPAPRDGRNQSGRYYLGQVDDRGAASIWRREQDRWVELVAWIPCPALRPATDPNDLTLEMVGGQLSLMVNGQLAARANDMLLDDGGVGLYVSGNGTDMLVERFVVHALS